MTSTQNKRLQHRPEKYGYVSISTLTLKNLKFGISNAKVVMYLMIHKTQQLGNFNVEASR